MAMQPTLDPKERAAIDAEAIEIIVLLLSGEATVADGAAIRAWRALSETHEAAFACAVRTWRGLAEAARAAADASPSLNMPRKAAAASVDRGAARRSHARLAAGALERRTPPDLKKSRFALRKLPPRSV